MLISNDDLYDLIALVESGPLDDGDTCSPRSRDNLIQAGLAVRVIVNGNDGYTAATYKGRDAYTERFHLPGEISNTIAEAHAARVIQNTLRREGIK